MCTFSKPTIRTRSCLRSLGIWAAPIALCGAAAAGGETLVVDTATELVDFGGAQTVAELPGPDGLVSFAEAIAASNNTAGPQTIAFNIPQSEWFLTNQFAYVRVGFGALVITDDQLTIDGTTQTAFTGDTNPGGAEVGFFNTIPNSAGAPVLLVASDDNSFMGLGPVFQRGALLEIAGNRNRVVNCQIHGPLFAAIELTGNDNVIGGTAPGEGNELTSGTEGLRFTAPASGNLVIGNLQIQGADYGIRLYAGADGNTVGGPSSAERNVISGSGHTGQQFVPVGGQLWIESDGNLIQGNSIGADLSGTQIVPAPGWFGVKIRAGSGNQVLDNVIVGSTGSNAPHYGIQVVNDSHGNVFKGNRIGTDPSGTLALPNEFGMYVGKDSVNAPAPDGNVVGGTGPGEGNVFAFNTGNALKVGSFTTAITVSGNSFHDNGLLGIDLDENDPVAYPDNVSTNDPGDLDTGGNGRLNYPVITAVVDSGISTIVTGSLDTQSPATAVVELFTSSSADPCSFGEGETYRASALPDAAGAFTAVLPGGLGALVFTATTTDAAGNTSEFSPAFGAPGNVTVYCTAEVNSQNCRPEMVSLGTPSYSAGSGFDVRASLIVNGVSGLLFYGRNGPKSTPFGGGTMCVQGPVRRTPVQSSDGTFFCAGTFSFDFNAWIATGKDPGLAPGQQVWCQYWSRDASSPSTTNLTDALTFVIEP